MAKTKFQIKNRYTGEIIVEKEDLIKSLGIVVKDEK